MSIRVEKKGNGYRLATALWLPLEIGQVFGFFADAGNLNAITPEWLDFRITTPLPVTMRQGLRLDYRLRLRGIPIAWQSEITAWEPPHRFVDEQRKGPYRRWIHEHRFFERDGGTEVVDRVDYAVRGGWLVHRFFVERDLRAIFDHRQNRLKAILAAGRLMRDEVSGQSSRIDKTSLCRQAVTRGP